MAAVAPEEPDFAAARAMAPPNHLPLPKEHAVLLVPRDDGELEPHVPSMQPLQHAREMEWRSLAARTRARTPLAGAHEAVPLGAVHHGPTHRNLLRARDGRLSTMQVMRRWRQKLTRAAVSAHPCIFCGGPQQDIGHMRLLCARDKEVASLLCGRVDGFIAELPLTDRAMEFLASKEHGCRWTESLMAGVVPGNLKRLIATVRAASSKGLAKAKVFVEDMIEIGEDVYAWRNHRLTQIMQLPMQDRRRAVYAFLRGDTHFCPLAGRVQQRPPWNPFDGLPGNLQATFQMAALHALLVSRSNITYEEAMSSFPHWMAAVAQALNQWIESWMTQYYPAFREWSRMVSAQAWATVLGTMMRGPNGQSEPWLQVFADHPAVGNIIGLPPEVLPFLRRPLCNLPILAVAAMLDVGALWLYDRQLRRVILAATGQRSMAVLVGSKQLARIQGDDAQGNITEALFSLPEGDDNVASDARHTINALSLKAVVEARSGGQCMVLASARGPGLAGVDAIGEIVEDYGWELLTNGARSLKVVRWPRLLEGLAMMSSGQQILGPASTLEEARRDLLNCATARALAGASLRHQEACCDVWQDLWSQCCGGGCAPSRSVLPLRCCGCGETAPVWVHQCASPPLCGSCQERAGRGWPKATLALRHSGQLSSSASKTIQGDLRSVRVDGVRCPGAPTAALPLLLWWAALDGDLRILWLWHHRGSREEAMGARGNAA